MVVCVSKFFYKRIHNKIVYKSSMWKKWNLCACVQLITRPAIVSNNETPVTVDYCQQADDWSIPGVSRSRKLSRSRWPCRVASWEFASNGRLTSIFFRDASWAIVGLTCQVNYSYYLRQLLIPMSDNNCWLSERRVSILYDVVATNYM